MAERPWVEPEDVRNYTSNTRVKERSDGQLKIDITRAEQYIITYTHNDFRDADEVPEEVKAAVVILAEAYSWNAYVAAREYQSETHDDYSYTSGATAIDLDDLNLAALLDPFKTAQATGNVIMRLRKL